MESVMKNRERLTVKDPLPSAWRMFFLFFFVLFSGTVRLLSQCPNTGQTKVIKPDTGTGYSFYKFLGDGSFSYFLDGKTFSFNGKDDPGRTIIFIDNIAYESILVERVELKKYVKSSKDLEVLRAQAKHHQDYFKRVDPTMVITDFGPSEGETPEDRLFYLWKKESPPGKKAATQYLLSTQIKDGVVVLSIMPMEASISEEDVFVQIRKCTSYFNTLSSDRCAKVLALPSAP